MRGWLILPLLLWACDDGDAPLSCGQLVDQCPPGSSAILGERAVSSCDQAQGGIALDGTGQANGQCLESSECRVLCQFDVPCRCGVAAITRQGIECASCDGAASCGNGICEGGETPAQCPIDCGEVCEPDERRCDGPTLQECSLQGRWDSLPCPSGEACTAQDGPPRCERDVRIIDEGDGGVGQDGGPDRPMDGRVILGDGDWPGSTYQPPAATPRDFDFEEIRLPRNDARAQLFAAFDRLGGERIQLVPGERQFSGYGLSGSILAGFDGVLVLPPAPELTPAERDQLCEGYSRCRNQPVDQCQGWLDEAISERGGAFIPCVLEILAEEPMSCAPFIFECGWDPIYPYPEQVGLRPAVMRRGDRILGGDDGSARVVDLATGMTRRMRPVGEYRLDLNPPGVDLSRDGRVAAMTAGDGLDEVLVHWPVNGEERSAVLPIARGNTSHVRLSPDGRVVALRRNNTTDPRADDVWSFWLPETETHLFSIRPFENARLEDLAFSPDGRHMAMSMSRPGRIEIWDLERLARVQLIADNPDVTAGAPAFAFSPDGSYLAVPDEGGLGLWSVETGQRFVTLENVRGLPVWEIGGLRFMTGSLGTYVIATGR